MIAVFKISTKSCEFVCACCKNEILVNTSNRRKSLEGKTLLLQKAFCLFVLLLSFCFVGWCGWRATNLVGGRGGGIASRAGQQRVGGLGSHGSCLQPLVEIGAGLVRDSLGVRAVHLDRRLNDASFHTLAVAVLHVGGERQRSRHGDHKKANSKVHLDKRLLDKIRFSWEWLIEIRKLK